jgi:hypothetical protein
MQAAVETLTKNYSRKHLSPSGVQCSFFKIDNKWGVKVYRKESKRDECFDCQGECAEYGYGPRVGEKFDMNMGDETLYCYVTEIAECLIPQEWFEIVNSCRDYAKKYIDTEHWDEELYYSLIEDGDAIFDPIDDEWDERICELCSDISENVGWAMTDRHAGNFGLLDGKLVCIDFGLYDGMDS